MAFNLADAAPVTSASNLNDAKPRAVVGARETSKAGSNSLDLAPLRVASVAPRLDSGLPRGAVVPKQAAPLPTTSEQNGPKSERAGSGGLSRVGRINGGGGTPAPCGHGATYSEGNERTLSSLIEGLLGSREARSVTGMEGYLDEAWEELQLVKARLPPAGAGTQPEARAARCIARLQALLRIARREIATPRGSVHAALQGLKGCFEDSMGHIEQAPSTLEDASWVNSLQIMFDLLDLAAQKVDKLWALLDVIKQEE